jgi:hypothetical protein
MGPPLEYQPPTFVQAAKDICKAAWNISEVASTMYQHTNAATTPDIRSALSDALNGCKTELYAVHSDIERVSGVVKYAAGVMWQTDYRFGQQLYDGADYDTRHNQHPYPFLAPGQIPPYNPPWLVPNGKLPGE